MASVEIPVPEFGFDEIAKEKAQFIIQQLLHHNSIFQFFSGSNPGLKGRLEAQILELYEDYERLICIVEVLSFLAKEETSLRENVTFNSKDPAIIATGFNKIRYILYSLAKHSANYNFDTNTFSVDEFVDVNSKIDDIIYSLRKLEAGQEILFDEFENIKSHISDEFEDLKKLPALGKKTFYQILFGKVSTFTGNKIAEEIFKKLEPQIIALILLHAPHLIEEAKKLIE